jgi:hypothetical protein
MTFTDLATSRGAQHEAGFEIVAFSSIISRAYFLFPSVPHTGLKGLTNNVKLDRALEALIQLPVGVF